VRKKGGGGEKPCVGVALMKGDFRARFSRKREGRCFALQQHVEGEKGGEKKPQSLQEKRKERVCFLRIFRRRRVENTQGRTLKEGEKSAINFCASSVRERKEGTRQDV